MTDLKNMSEVELRQFADQDTATEGLKILHYQQAFDELARRLREQEKELTVFKQLHVDEVTWRERDRAALLACQAREGELREAAQLLRHYWLLTKKSHIEHPQMDEWERAWEKLDQALSHSTGSKIMTEEDDARLL